MDEKIVLYNQEGNWAVAPLTPKASRKYGSRAKWCTSSSSADKYFPYYTTNGQCLVIFSINGEKYQALYKNNAIKMVCDANDTMMDINEFYDICPFAESIDVSQVTDALASNSAPQMNEGKKRSVKVNLTESQIKRIVENATKIALKEIKKGKRK